MRFSVVIATRNRRVQAVRATRSALEQDYSPNEFEVIVVDNGSTDGTPEALAGLGAEFPGVAFRAISEPEPGASQARNAGLSAAVGEYVAFLDDDGQAPPGWLAAVDAGIAAAGGSPAALGGPVEPLYDCEKPSWFKDSYERRTWGSQARLLGPSEVLSGSNMVWRASVLRQIGGFDVGLGPKGNRFAMGEDTELFVRLRRQTPNAVVWFAPAALIFHSVPMEKTRIMPAFGRAYKEGQAWVAIRPPANGAARLAAILRRLGALLVFICLAVLSFGWLYRPHNWAFEWGRRVFLQVGNLRGLLRLG